MRKSQYKILFSLCLLACLFFIIKSYSQASPIDSTFWDLSLPEILSYKTYYMQELEVYQREKQSLIQRGIEDGESLLNTNSDPGIIGDILIRLANLYYYQEKDEYFNQMSQFDDRLMLFEAGELDQVPVEPKVTFKKSLEMYQRIIDEFPQSEFMDDAVYNKAFLFEEMSEHTRANQVYQHLIEEFPQSKYLPEAYMRLAEYHFNPPINNLDQAIHYYRLVTRYKNSPRYEEALYKLGWSHYRLDQYPEAISFFTMLAETEKSKDQHNRSTIRPRADLHDEALEYIAISFIDFGGPAKARAYLKEIGDPLWGQIVMEKLGDVYKDQKEEFGNAVSAYQTLLDYAPYSSDAPKLQKKVADSFQFMDDETRAFEEKQKLFMLYKPNSTWWTAVSDEKARLAAYKLTEQSLRENIQTLIRKAESGSKVKFYEEAVELAETYLNTFPEDLYAYMIRWNMTLILDTKLNLYEKALKEYLTISLVYHGKHYETFAREKGLATIKDAAENAIVVADSLLRREKANDTGYTLADLTVYNSDTTDLEKIPISFSRAEEWLAASYDNYVELFPFDEKTASILVNAGVLHYTHNQYDEAIKYFKTLTEYFPKSEQVHQVMHSIMESYFGKKDYTSAELVAKRILDKEAPKEIKNRAEKRLGESIFLKAENLADEGHAKIAADEYYRMALEVPTIEFADKALFNSGNEYDKVKGYPFAIRAYEQLCSLYPGSEYYIDAMNNLAFDYVEVGDFENAAQRYEVLADLYKKGEKSRDALYNAWIFYSKVENWAKGIDVGKKYAIRFPRDAEASSIYFAVAGYYQKLQQDQQAMEIYEDFTNRFPDSAVGVEAYFSIGNYFQKIDFDAQAEEAYQKAFNHSQSLKKRGLDGNDYFAAEALFFASAILYQNFNQIHFQLPQSALDRSITQKQTLLRQLVDQYTKVAAYATHRLPESVFRIGDLYERYAKTWSDQELPPLGPTSRAVREKEINEKTIQIFEQSLSAYKKALGVLIKVVDDMFVKNRRNESNEMVTIDSVLIETEGWLNKTRDKVSETLFQMAEVNTQSIDYLLHAPVPAELTGMARLEYNSQVLVKAIKPLLDNVIEAHFRNLAVSDSLFLKNNWIEASREKILTILPLLGQQYEGLCFETLNNFRNAVNHFRNLTFEKQLSASQDDINNMVNFIELAKTYAQAAVVFYKDGVDKINRSPYYNGAITPCQQYMVAFALNVADSLESLIALARMDQNRANQRFEETNDLLFEDCLAAFEDNVYFLDDNLKHILETTYAIEQSFKQKAPFSGWIAIRLLRVDPETYLNQFDIPVKTMTIGTDTTWRYTWVYNPGWEKYDFTVFQWLFMKGGTGYSNPEGDIFPSSHQIFGISSIPNEQTFYVRKPYRIPGFPITSQLEINVSCPYRLYLNGQLVMSETEEQPITVTPHLKREGNVFGLELLSRHTFSLKGKLLIRYIPNEALPKTEG